MTHRSPRRPRKTRAPSAPRAVADLTTATAVAVRRQLEFYFSSSNLKKDRFMQQQLLASPTPGVGWVEVSVVAGFNKMRKMTSSLVQVAACVHASDDLVLGVGPTADSATALSVVEVPLASPAPGTQASPPYPRERVPWVRRLLPFEPLSDADAAALLAPSSPRAPLGDRMLRLEAQLARLRASAVPAQQRGSTHGCDSPFASSQALKIFLRRIVRLAMSGEFATVEGGAELPDGCGSPATRLLSATLAALDMVDQVAELPQLAELRSQVSALSASVIFASRVREMREMSAGVRLARAACEIAEPAYS